MLTIRRGFPSALVRCGHRNFIPFFGLGSLFDELDHGYSVGPRVSVKAAQDHVALELDVPRFRSNELKVTTRDNTLTISGEKAPQSQDARQHMYGDAPATTFARTFAIPRGLDLTKVKTELDHGVFTVTIPKIVEPKPEPVKLEAPDKATPPQGAKSDAALTCESSPRSPLMDLSRMSWPPKVKIADSETQVKYTVSLPESVTRENIDMRLQGRYLNVTVHHEQLVEKKDTRGNVVFSERQSVNYSTPVIVPEGTRAADVSTSLENGTLTISVAKHGEAQQSIKVN